MPDFHELTSLKAREFEFVGGPFDGYCINAQDLGECALMLALPYSRDLLEVLEEGGMTQDLPITGLALYEMQDLQTVSRETEHRVKYYFQMSTSPDAL